MAETAENSHVHATGPFQDVTTITADNSGGRQHKEQDEEKERDEGDREGSVKLEASYNNRWLPD